jgi:RNA polymerase sigma factor (sigma-70 family)
MSRRHEDGLWELLPEQRAQLEAILHRAYRGFARVLGPGALDDCRQEVILLLWEQQETLAAIPAQKRMAYAEAVVLHAALRFFRQAGRAQERTTGLEEADTQERATPGPEAGEPRPALEAIGFAGWVGMPELLEALKALPPRAYGILDLHYREGLSFAEIAQRLDSNEAAVRKRHSRAIGALKKHLRGGNSMTKSRGKSSKALWRCCLIGAHRPPRVQWRRR